MKTRISRFPTFMLALGAITLSLGGIAAAQPSEGRKAHKKERRDERLKKFDLNADGQLSEAERSAMWKHRFARVDANGDSQITLEELRAMRKQRREMKRERREMKRERREMKRERREMKRGQAGWQHEGKKRHHRRRGKKDMAKHFAQADLDNSGGISWEEFKVKAKQRRERREKFQHRRRHQRNERNQQI